MFFQNLPASPRPSPARGEWVFGRKAAMVFCVFLIFLSGAFSNAFAGETLTLNYTSISFADADPDVTPYITANTQVQIFAKLTGKPPSWRLVHRAATDLQSGSHTIPISNISWTTDNPSYASGTMSTVADQLIISGSGNHSAIVNFTFSFRNLWSHPPGSYTATTTFTLSSP